ncbi:hypothetical protein [Sulfitobacter aestuariivivens]|uniref:Uncharacterized protein n=1 Tax=Sulfitobacter aestuariivivens TaxID=2766981 RepID=A0A927D1R4_9RHOB|nr:hypothetical protein [Sulfitobacter aestuariivivens]
MTVPGAARAGQEKRDHCQFHRNNAPLSPCFRLPQARVGNLKLKQLAADTSIGERRGEELNANRIFSFRHGNEKRPGSAGRLE